MNEQLEKLNAYLISKGRPPKEAKGINFVKHNISNIRQKKKPSSTNLNKSNGILTLSHSNKSHQRQEKTQNGVRNIKASQTKTYSKVKFGSCTNRVGGRAQTSVTKENKAWTPKSNPVVNIKHPARLVKKIEGNTPKSVSKSQTKCKTPKTATKVIPQPKVNIGTTNLISKTLVCKSAGPRLSSRPRLLRNTKCQNEPYDDEQLKLYQKLNSWLISKGKKPLTGKKLRGFKPAKTIATPVGSPIRPSKPAANGSHWQGLRDEDANDEITVLIRHTMSDVEVCLNEGCSPDILLEMLRELAEKLPTAKSQSKYWLMLAQVEIEAGKSDEVIFDLYEKAILANAQPIEEIKEALQKMILQKVEPAKEEIKTKNIDQVSSRKRSRTFDGSECEELFSPIPSKQCKTPNPHLERLIRAETPLHKNAATSPIIFESPSANPNMLSPVSSPSSVVKLRIISKSSPVFNRLKSMRALPDEASAIVTPVRRSQRIADAQENYPKSLQDHEPCLTTIQEILPVIGNSSNQEEKSNTTACDVVFDPNSALGDEYSDIATVLKF